MLISVCVPTYNRLADLKIALASIITASNLLDEPIEIIVSDNASPDGTQHYLESLTDLKSNISLTHWTNSENIGGLENTKKLLRHAKGEYIFFLTDDDLVLPNVFLLLKKYINEYAPNFIKFANITYLIKSKKTFFYGHKYLLNDFNTHKNFIKIESYAHILSGCVIKNIPEITETLKSSVNVYISIEMCALSAGACMYINEPAIIHQWENEVFWEKDVDISTNSKKMQRLTRDAQLALLKIPDDFFSRIEQRQMCESILKRYGYLEIEIQKKFKLDYVELKIIQLKALTIRLTLKTSYLLKSLFTKLISKN